MATGKSSNWLSPKGSRIIGTSDTVPCRANITGIYDDGSPEHEGGTEVFWDDQKTNKRDGKILFLDDDGNEWTFDQLVKEEPGEEGPEEDDPEKKDEDVP